MAAALFTCQCISEKGASMCMYVGAGSHLMPSTSGSFMMSTMTRFLEMGSEIISVISCWYLR